MWGYNVNWIIFLSIHPFLLGSMMKISPIYVVYFSFIGLIGSLT